MAMIAFFVELQFLCADFLTSCVVHFCDFIDCDCSCTVGVSYIIHVTLMSHLLSYAFLQVFFNTVQKRACLLVSRKFHYAARA